MGNKIVKVSSNLPFDEEQEQDIIKYLEKLQDSHKIGQFLATVVRAAYDCPELLSMNEDNASTGPTAKQIQDLGMAPSRYQFFKSVTKEVSDMKDKVDKIYDMVLKTYELALMGKHLALEDKSKNEILANFILQKQLKDLQDALGVQLTSSVFASNKTQDVEKLANEVLEYIINSYDSVISELKDTVASQPVIVQQVQATNNDNTAANSNKATNSTNNSSEEIVDFGGNFKDTVDEQALNNFFGND